MRNLAFRARTYLSYRKRAVNQYGLHSPFLFELYNACFKPRFKHNFPDIKKLRAGLLKNDRQISINDYGAGSLVNNSQSKGVNQMFKSASISTRQGELFNRLILYFKPESVIELGTHLGVSGLYFLQDTATTLYTFEGCQETQGIAKETLMKFGSRAQFYKGKFEDELPSALSNLGHVSFAYVDGNHTYDGTLWNFNTIKEYSTQDTVIILDDINWSPDMKKAWEEITLDPEVSLSVNCHKFGLVFFKIGVEKQNVYFKF